MESSAKIVISWSEHYYLDCGGGNMFGDNSWCDPFKTALKMYRADPLYGVNLQLHPDRVIGGESCMWGELTNEDSLPIKVWPVTPT